MPLEGSNVGLFGLTSTGKSTMLNALLGQKVADTGVGETTTKITPYKGTRFTLWDVPGRNDEVSYLSMKYISFFKGLSRRLILIQATVRENSSMIKLLDEVGLRYDIVFNKFDKVEEDEQNEIKKQIRSEVEKLGLRGVNKIYFVSAKNPQMFDDWLLMVDNLTK
jgi:small GTP-binding protein